MLNKAIFSTLFPHLKNNQGNTGLGAGSDVPPANPQAGANPNDVQALQGIGQAASQGQQWVDPNTPPSAGANPIAVGELSSIGQAARTGGDVRYQPQTAAYDPSRYAGLGVSDNVPYPGQAQAAPEPDMPTEPPPPVGGWATRTPGDIDELAGIGKASKRGKEWDPERHREMNPNPVDPNASPEEQKRQALAFWENERNNPTNRNKGVKGLLLELAENFLYGMSKTQPGMNIGHGLLLGATGAGAGFFNKKWNEVRRAENEIPGAREALQFETQQSQRKSAIANNENQILNRNAQTRIDISKEQRAQLTAEQNNIFRQWEKAGKTVTRQTHPRLFAAADKANMDLADKEEGDEYTTHVSNGRVITTNKRTGEYKIGSENLAPSNVKIDDKDLDAMLGIAGDKELEDAVTAEIAPGNPGITFRQEIVDAMPPETRNPDGSFNMEAFNRLKEKDDPRVSGVSLSQIIDKAPDDYKQRHAGEVTKRRTGQKGMRAEAAKLKTALANHRPGPNATPKPIAKVIDVFKKIMEQPPSEERDAALRKFYNGYLPNVRPE
jgi:hypothetical protein